MDLCEYRVLAILMFGKYQAQQAFSHKERVKYYNSVMDAVMGCASNARYADACKRIRSNLSFGTEIPPASVTETRLEEAVTRVDMIDREFRTASAYSLRIACSVFAFVQRTRKICDMVKFLLVNRN